MRTLGSPFLMRAMPATAGVGRRHTNGFTLIELMVTILVAAILATLAGPSFRQLIAAQQVRSATSALTESLWLARSEAIKRNATVGVEFADVANGWQVKAGDIVLHSQPPFPRVSSETGGDFQFNAFGRVTVAGTGKVTVGVESANVFRCVTVSTTGRVSTVEGKCS